MQAYAEAIVGYGMKVAICPLEEWCSFAPLIFQSFPLSLPCFLNPRSLHPVSKSGHCLLLHFHLHQETRLDTF
jgi:hypothetical protein